MGKEKFSIDAFASALGAVSNLDTREQIEYIDLSLIDEDAGNFYTLSGLDDLAANIEVVGLQQPLRVRSGESGRVTIVSGHRRRAAIAKLVEEGREDLRQVPCIREADDGDEDMRQLRLIYANSGTRVLTPAELAQQAQTVEMLLYRLKEAGHEFPGRMRDQVAAACNVSASKLARLKVIREKLENPFLEQFNRNELSEQAAYALARLTMDQQRDVASVAGKKPIAGANAELLLKHADRYYRKEETLKCPNGRGCDNVLGFLKQTAKCQYSWQACDSGSCCRGCSSRASCAGACDEAKKLSAQDKAEREANKARVEADTRKRSGRYRAESVCNAQRILRAVDACGDVGEKEKLPVGMYNNPVPVATLRKHAADQFDDDPYFYSAWYAPSAENAVKLAQRLGCTTDYLLGLTDELTPVCGVDLAAWRTDKEYPTGGWIVGVFDVGYRTRLKLAFARADGLYFDEGEDSPKMLTKPVRWVALPEDEEE